MADPTERLRVVSESMRRRRPSTTHCRAPRYIKRGLSQQN
ncbi:hypothetical protein [Nocardia australiensis]